MASGDCLGRFCWKGFLGENPAISTGRPMSRSTHNKVDQAMSEESQHSTDRLQWEFRAADALELARLMAPGPERNEALKMASLLRCTADAKGLIFAKRGRPRK